MGPHELPDSQHPVPDDHRPDRERRDSHHDLKIGRAADTFDADAGRRLPIVSVKQQGYRAAYTMVYKMQLDHLAKRSERLRQWIFCAMDIMSTGGDDGGCDDGSNGITVSVVEGC